MKIEKISILIALIVLLKVNSQDNNLFFAYDYCFDCDPESADLESIEQNNIYFYNNLECSSVKKGIYYFFLESNIDIINDKNDYIFHYMIDLILVMNNIVTEL